MPTNYAGASTWRSTVTLPAGADPQTRSSFVAPLTELADRSSYLYGIAVPNNVLPHRFHISSLSFGTPDGVWVGDYAGTSYAPVSLVAATWDTARMYASLDLARVLPSGAVVSRIRALVEQATDTPSLRMVMHVNEGTCDYGSTPAAPTWTHVAGVFASADAGVQVLDTGTLATPITITRSTPLPESTAGFPQRSLLVSIGQESAPGSRFFGVEVWATLPPTSNR